MVSEQEGTNSELDAVFDLSQQFPPLTQPGRPALDMASIRSLMVSAVAVAGDVIKLCDEPNTSPELKSVTRLLIALLRAMEGVVGGLVSFSAAFPTANAPGRGHVASARRQINPPPAAPKPPVPSTRELMEALESADKESVVFGANLGSLPLANRTALNTNFSVELLRKMEEKARGGSGELLEATRLVEDALACVEKIEFWELGQKNR